MAAFQPVGGKFGKVILGALSTNFSEWSIASSAKDIDVTGFNCPIDADGVGYEEGIAGLVSAECNIKGRYDVGNDPLQTLKLRAGLNVVIFFGITQAIGFTYSCRILGSNAQQNVQDAANFDFRVKVNGKLFT